jgi:hypothetical protein
MNGRKGLAAQTALVGRAAQLRLDGCLGWLETTATARAPQNVDKIWTHPFTIKAGRLSTTLAKVYLRCRYSRLRSRRMAAMPYCSPTAALS